MIAELLADALEAKGFPREAVSMIESTDREATGELMKLRGIVDVLIPRGGAGLIQRCVRESLVPVIETGTGNCHIYVHESADFDKALNIIVNAKTQRVGVCNAAESLLVDRAVADSFLPAVVAVLHDHGVLIHGDDATCAACADADLAEGDDFVAATEEDWGREYLALEMSVKVVANEGEAIAHINRYGTMHSEAIIAETRMPASASWMRSMPRPCTPTPVRALPTAASLAWAPRSASRPKSSTPADPSPPRPSPPTNTSSAAPVRFAPKPLANEKPPQRCLSPLWWF